MTAPALLLAVVGALCFAGGAVLQHGAIAPRRRVDLRELLARPRWLAGAGLAAAGAGVHVFALVLAPVSVVQPVGVLAVPIAVALSLRDQRPPVRVVAGAALCVAGVALVVRTAAAATPDAPADLGRFLLVSGTTAAAAGLALAVVAARTAGRVRCVAFAAAGAVAFGLVSALLRAVSVQLGTADVGTVLGAAAALAVALAAGGWLVQQGFAAGPPAVVVAALTVVDPLVATGLGTALLGEAGGLGAAGVALLLGAGAVAAAGVALLSRHHPDAAPRPVPHPSTRPSTPREVPT
ncbi:hypothetical protein LWC33_26475 [Pseudonocardia sp. RS11V-5]|uniref:hypothetical protein n=1 Tax=Pseudonocardia terrae TaxID=2905831 RepID=UPI001E2B17E0|nr:hypothetical protein [Pseudonocardia terrae]MCE3554986.1 hypothetical protein [Pseudonocardia terrae]